MPATLRRFAPLVLVVALSACASPAKLARQSSEALAKGDLRKAYDRALRAIEKDPMHQAARSAYAAVSERVDADYRARVTARAVADTQAAADLALDAQRFRRDVARHGTALDVVPDYDAAERAILSGAARIHYRRGVDAMASRRPKVAVDEFTIARRYDADFSDVVSRLEAARREATAYVALLPFANSVGVPGLSQEVGDTVQREIARRAPSEFRFTHIVAADEIERNMTVGEMRNLRRDDALVLGQRVRADWIVVGRFRGLRSNSSERALTQPLYHRVDEKDDKGVVTGVRWEESSLRVTTRTRDVAVQFEFDVLDVATGVTLAHREEPAQAVARVTWTDYRPEEHYDRYALLPPDVRKAEPERAKKVDAQWRDFVGSWDLDDLLRSARDQRARARYSPRYRGEFYNDTRGRPVWLGELPGENELAFVALHEVWRSVLAVLKELDAK